MRNPLVFVLILVSTLGYSQKSNFGTEVIQEGAIASTEILNLMDAEEEIAMKVQGTINEVCQAKGCWMSMDLGNDQSMRITFKDYGFFVPINSSGKVAIVKGVAKKEIIDVETLRHYAKDAGKSEAEIAAIMDPETSFVLVAEGVLLVD